MSDLPAYNHIQLELTSRCNLRCRTCLYGHYPERWVAADLAPAVFDRILAVAPRTRSVHLQCWGESFLREDCPELIARMKKAGPAVSISSNGSVMSLPLARALIDAGLDSMAFSFAGTSPREQDPLRGTVSLCVYLNPPLNSTVPRLVEGAVMESPRVIMGRLPDQTLDEIWHQPAYRSFRHAFAQRVKAYETV